MRGLLGLLLLAAVAGVAVWHWSSSPSSSTLSTTTSSSSSSSFPFPPKFKTKSPTPHERRDGPIPGSPPGVPLATDCMLRNLAFDFGKRIANRQTYKHLYDALQLDAYCAPYSVALGGSTTLVDDAAAVVARRQLEDETPSSSPLNASVLILYCDAKTGRDTHSGSKDKPLRTISEALKRVEKFRASKSQILLREGTFYLAKPLVIHGQAHSELTIRSFAQERAVLTGALRVRIAKSQWKRYTAAPSRAVVWRTTLPASVDSDVVHGLRLGTSRLTRAKFPNGAPEQSQHTSGNSGWYTAPSSKVVEWDKPVVPQHEEEKPGVAVESTPGMWPKVDWPDHAATSQDEFQYRALAGMGGRGVFRMGNACARLKPKTGYFCTTKNELAGAQAAFRAPSGVRHLPVRLPASGSSSTPPLVVAWSGANSHAWTFEVDKVSGGGANAKFKPATVGIQGAQGSDYAGEGGFYVENALSLLDEPGEFYYDRHTRELYVCLNTTQVLTGLEDWGLVLQKELVHVQDGARNVHLLGLEFRDTALTWLEPHASVHGGDWTLPKSGAAIMAMNGVDGLVVEQCTFTGLDGSAAVLLHGRVRGARFLRNEFAWLGGSAIVSWGRTSPCLNHLCTRRLPLEDGAGGGPDGRQGDQPRGTVVQGNVFRELGVFVKQSAAYFSAVSGQSEFTGNVVFNLPRSALVFHDGFLGGDQVHGNLIFNTGKEGNTSTAAPVDMVDRVPLIWEGSGGGTTQAAPRVLRGNFVMANYNATAALANTRDGASNVRLVGNVLVYGGVGLRTQHAGRGLHAEANLFVHLQSHCFLAPPSSSSSKSSSSSLMMSFVNNTCLLTNAPYGYASACSAQPYCAVNNNRVALHAAGASTAMRVRCGSGGKDQLLSDHLRKHHNDDRASQQLAAFPSDGELSDWVRQMLGI